MISPRALAHNKFLVICDTQKKPRWVWTGSQNWTKTGLCTQANNSVLIDDATLAAEYRGAMGLAPSAGDTTPADLKTSNSKPRDRDGRARRTVRLWFTPTVGQVDLERGAEDHRRREAGHPFPDVQSRAEGHAAE